MKITAVQSAKAPPAVGGYAQAVETVGVERILYVSGQVPETVDGVIPEAFIDQARLAWSNVLAQLAASRMSVGNLAKVTIFLSDRRYAVENREVRQEVLVEHAPALTVIITGIFDPRWLLEIEAVAVA